MEQQTTSGSQSGRATGKRASRRHTPVIHVARRRNSCRSVINCVRRHTPRRRGSIRQRSGLAGTVRTETPTPGNAAAVENLEWCCSLAAAGTHVPQQRPVKERQKCPARRINGELHASEQKGRAEGAGEEDACRACVSAERKEMPQRRHAHRPGTDQPPHPPAIA